MLQPIGTIHWWWNTKTINPCNVHNLHSPMRNLNLNFFEYRDVDNRMTDVINQFSDINIHCFILVIGILYITKIILFCLNGTSTCFFLLFFSLFVCGFFCLFSHFSIIYMYFIRKKKYWSTDVYDRKLCLLFYFIFVLLKLCIYIDI